MYPLMVMAFATLVLIGMLMFLVPIFVDIFAQLGGDLPMLTQLVVKASEALKSYWFIIFPAWGGIIYGFLRLKKTDRQGHPEDRHGAFLAHALDAHRLGR
jgi:type IV pilus assembly protein PilC